jgi:multidrug efflux pump subunit AcrB
VATLRESRGHARIQRVDGRRSVSVQGDVDARRGNAAAILADIRERLLPRLAEEFPDVNVVFEGQSADAGETGASIARGFLIGLVAIFVLLSFQFRSYLEPLAVMTAIPLALIGVVAGHLVMGIDLSMPSVMGFVSLAGIVVNDSILLVSFLKMNMDEGMEVEDAARRASRERFRAVLLTSLTTIAGLLPLLAERSVQAQVLIPLVTSIAFGLMATTVLVLLVVPCLFAILHDLGLTGSAGAPRAQPRETARAG